MRRFLGRHWLLILGIFIVLAGVAGRLALVRVETLARDPVMQRIVHV